MTDSVAPPLSPRRYGPWAVVAGASQGSGSEFARQLAAAGFSVMLVARRQGLLDALADEVRDEYGVQTRTLTLDLTRADAADTMFAAAADLEVGMYVSNAGADVALGEFVDLPIERSLAVISVNVITLTKACHLFLAPMRERRRGAIVVMTSVTGIVGGQPGVACYGACKAFGLSFAESLSRECGKFGVDAIGIGAPPMVSEIAADLAVRIEGLREPKDVVRVALQKLGTMPSYIFDYVGVEAGHPVAVAKVRRNSESTYSAQRAVAAATAA